MNVALESIPLPASIPPPTCVPTQPFENLPFPRHLANISLPAALPLHPFENLPFPRQFPSFPNLPPLPPPSFENLPFPTQFFPNFSFPPPLPPSSTSMTNFKKCEDPPAQSIQKSKFTDKILKIKKLDGSSSHSFIDSPIRTPKNSGSNSDRSNGKKRQRIVYDLDRSDSNPKKSRLTVAQRILLNSKLLKKEPDQMDESESKTLETVEKMEVSDDEQVEFKTPKRKPIIFDLELPTSTKSDRVFSKTYGEPPGNLTKSNTNFRPMHDRNYGQLAEFDRPRVFVGTNGQIFSMFFTNRYCFSNHFKCPIIIDGEKFVCTEQYYMYWKARIFDDERAAEEILSADDPKIMKRVGSSIRHFNQEKWDAVSVDVMAIANMRKYEQNPKLREALFETMDTLLVEASPMDQRWGIGMDMFDDAIRDPRRWRGKNILGRMLTKIRDRLMSRPEFQEEVAKIYAKAIE